MTPRYTRHTYELVARRLKFMVSEFSTQRDKRSLLERLASGYAADFAEDNPRFDRARFMEACGL